MPFPLDDVFRSLAVAKGELPATLRERNEAQAWLRRFVDQLTHHQQQAAPGDLSITHESVRSVLEAAYREHRRREERLATRRLLQDED